MSEQRVEQATLDPTLGLGEFLTTMQLFAGASQREVADYLQVSQQTVSRWMKGTSSPAYDSDSSLLIKQTFDLSEDSMLQLITNNKPWDKPETRPTPKSREMHRLDVLSGLAVDQTQFPERMMAAFVLRAEQGPPITEVEAELIKFLISKTVDSPES